MLIINNKRMGAHEMIPKGLEFSPFLVCRKASRLLITRGK